MKKHFTRIFIAVLLALTTLAAAWHLTTRTPETRGAVVVTSGENQVILHIDALPLTDVQGEIKNGKGEYTAVNAQAVSLPDLLAAAGSENALAVTVVSSDAYTAQLKNDEFDRAFIILQAENDFQLIVFGDPDSRRCVRSLTEVIVE